LYLLLLLIGTVRRGSEKAIFTVMDQGPLGDLTSLGLEVVHYFLPKYRAEAPLLLGMKLLMAALDVPAIRLEN